MNVWGLETRTETLLRPLRLPVRLWIGHRPRALSPANAFFENVHRDVGLLFRDDQWRAQPKRIRPGTQDQQPFVKRGIDDRVAQLGSGCALLFGPDDLDTDHQPAAAHIAHQWYRARPLAQALHHVLADLFRV